MTEGIRRGRRRRWLASAFATAVLAVAVPAAAADGAIAGAGAALAAAVDASASAGDLQPQPAARPDPSWEFSVTPYIWFAGLDGDVGVFPNLPPAQVDLSFGDVLDNLDFAGMAILQARHGRLVIAADVSYVDLGTSRDVGIRDPAFVEVGLDTSTFTTTFLAGYRAVDREALFLDLAAGGRLTVADTRLSLSGPNRALSRSSSETWLDPVVGGRLRAPMAVDWSLDLYGDVGGFGLSSDLTWQVLVSVNYRIGARWLLSAGWRHYAVDYDEADFLYDVAQTGPLLGVTYRFR